MITPGISGYLAFRSTMASRSEATVQPPGLRSDFPITQLSQNTVRLRKPCLRAASSL